MQVMFDQCYTESGKLTFFSVELQRMRFEGAVVEVAAADMSLELVLMIHRYER